MRQRKQRSNCGPDIGRDEVCSRYDSDAMCDLFAMSASYPATVRLSLEEFARHGGLSGSSKDGWGIAWYDAREVRIVKELFPAADSACVRFIEQHPFISPLAISHVRKATLGALALRNCQPFLRELGGRWHCFAHNGHLPGIAQDTRFPFDAHRPVGETDSEHAFCALLERLRPLWLANAAPSVAQRRQVIEAFAADLRELGPANFIYTDGEALFAHADRRHQTDGGIRPPGLWSLARRCPAGGEMTAAGLSIEARGAEQEVVLIASVALTGECWTALECGQILVACGGRLRPAPIDADVLGRLR
ncbi:MAG: class II glutamine amidotransferase [Burkholderiaceae bacterium]